MKLPYKYAVGLTVAIALFMAVLDLTIVNVAIVSMERDFKTTINSIQWVVTAYILAQAAVIPIAGYLSNRFGIKRVFIIALVVFTVGSLMCGLSPHIATGNAGLKLLIWFRIFQALGGGMLIPIGTSIVFNAAPPEERASSSAVIAVPILFAPALGPTVGGLIVDSNLGWPWVFFVNVPIGIIAIFLLLRVVRSDDAAPKTERAPFDYAGLFLSIIGVVLVVYAFVLVSQTKSGSITPQNPTGTINGWGYWLVWALMGGGFALLALFGILETKIVQDPVLDLRLFKAYDFATSAVVTWVTRATIFGGFLLVPLFLQQFQGKSAIHTGLILSAQGLGALVGIVSGSRLYDRVGPRILVAMGMVVLIGGTWWLLGITPTSDAAFFLPILFLRGIGFGWLGLPLQTVAFAAITGRALPKASSLYNATAQIFSSIGSAVVTTLLVQRATARGGDLVRAAQAAGARPPANLSLLAGTAAVRDVSVVLLIATVFAMLIGFLLPRYSLKQKQERGLVPTTPEAAIVEEEESSVAGIH